MSSHRLVRLASLVSVTALALGAAALACGGGNDNLPPPPPPPPAPMGETTPVATTPATATATAEPAKPAGPPPTLAPGAPSPDPEAPLPTVKIASPAKGQVIPEAKAKDFAVKLDVKNWKTAKGSSHVHLILDNKPYKPIYDTKEKVMLSDLSGGEALAEGEHVLVAFPSRANHESVKTKGALSVISFWVGKKGDAKDDPTKKPMLIYSRPKGDYKGEMANHVLVDFYLANTTLGDGKHVDIKVTGPGIKKPLEAKVEKWGTPYYLDNLHDGSYEVKLDLMDGDKAVEGPWNSTTRKIKVDHTAMADMAMPSDADAGAPPAAGKDGGAAKPDKGGKKDGKKGGEATGVGPGGSPMPLPTTGPVVPEK